MAQSKTTKELRILQIVPQLKVGGVERGVIDQFRYLNKNKIKNYIFCEKYSKNLFSESEIKHIISCDPLKFKDFRKYFVLNRYLKEIISSKKINLIHISSRAPALIFYRQIKNTKGIKYITSFHNPYSGSLIKKYYNSFLLKGESVICNSYFTNKFISEKFNIINDKLVTIPRGIDLIYFNPILFNKKIILRKKKILNISHKEIIISIPSRYSNWKGHNQLISFLNNQPIKLINNLRIIFFIDKKISQQKKILSLCNNLLKKKIILLNFTKDIREIYAISDIVINCSIKPEGFGRTISESLSMNRIPIGTNHGGVKEQLEHFDKKLLYNINNQKSFNSSLKYALHILKTTKFIGRKYVQKYYPLDKMLNTTLKIYKQNED